MGECTPSITYLPEGRFSNISPDGVAATVVWSTITRLVSRLEGVRAYGYDSLSDFDRREQTTWKQEIADLTGSSTLAWEVMNSMEPYTRLISWN